MIFGGSGAGFFERAPPAPVPEPMGWEEFVENLVYSATTSTRPTRADDDAGTLMRLAVHNRFRSILEARYGRSKLHDMVLASHARRIARALAYARERRAFDIMTRRGAWHVYHPSVARLGGFGEGIWKRVMMWSLFRNALGGGVP